MASNDQATTTTPAAELLVSVRSADEAAIAATAGAAVIDVKEPRNGPLGRADVAVWRDARRVVPARIPLSVALGELPEWRDGLGPEVPLGAFDGVAYCKIGLAGAGPDWRDEWRGLRARLRTRRCRWVAVAYSDWEAVGAPDPDAVLSEAVAVPEVVGVLIDTFDKASPARLGADWLPWTERARAARLRLAIAGGLTAETIAELAAFAPDLVAVRGAACENGDRARGVDPARVSALAARVREIGARAAS